MKKYLILLFSLISVFGYTQTLHPNSGTTALSVNNANTLPTTVSGTNTYTATLPSAGTITDATNFFTDITDRLIYYKFTNAATSAPFTLNLNSEGAKDLKKRDATGLIVDIVATDIAAGQVLPIRYNGTYLVIEGVSGGSGDFETMAGTPGAFSGNNLSYMRVSAGATQLEYRTPDGVASDLPAANTFTRGVLTAADWNTFNGKQSAITFGTGVQTALGVNIGSSGAPVVNGGALGTPSSGVGTNITGIVGTNVTNTPSGGIAATTVQAAINELDTEKENTANKATSFSTLNNTLFPTNQAVSDQLLYRSNITALTGSSGVDASISVATAVDRIPTTSTGAVATGTKICVVVSGKSYLYELKAGTLVEASPYIIRANDYATTTNEKYWEVSSTFNNIHLPQITAYLGSTGSDNSIWQATAVDRIPTTSAALGTRINAIVTISGNTKRLYTAELVTPADVTASVETSPSVIRPNDFNASTNNKVWIEVKNSGIIDVTHFGVVPNNGADLSGKIGAIITAASAGDALIFPPGTYNTYAITVNKKLHFYGYGAIIQFSGLSANMFNISVDGTTVQGFDFIGQGRTSGTYPNQGCIRITSCSNVRIQNCSFDLFPFFCIQTNATHISDTSGDFGGINIVNCTMMRSNNGFYADTRGEYVNLVGNTITDCNTGAYIGAGNIELTGNTITDCLNFALDYATGVNDGHGPVVGNQINHNTVNIRAIGLVNGEFFRSNHLYFGDMQFTNCNGIVLENNTIAGSTVQFDNCTNSSIENNKLDGRAGAVVINTAWNGNASSVYLANNKDFTNVFLAGWNVNGPVRGIKDEYADVNNTSTTETDLYSFTTPANSLYSNGEKIKAIYSGTNNDATATTQLKVYFAGTSIGDTGALTVVVGPWEANVLIIKTGSTTARASVSISTPGASTPVYVKQTDLTGLTLTGTNILKITGTAGGGTGGSSDITGKFSTVSILPAAY